MSGHRWTVAGGQTGYPPALAAIEDAPEILYGEGDGELLSGTAVAIVGSRRATGLGRTMAHALAAELAAAGAVVVSGCAVGIDAAAHAGALSVPGGATVGVLGGGLDVAAPAENRRLAAAIAARGCLLSEHPPGTPPLRHHFPIRNRIIAGLASVIVVVEAAARSGALITARLALAAGREVMAVPSHPLMPNSAGVNALIEDGAAPVRSADQVRDALGAFPLLPGVRRHRPVAVDSPLLGALGGRSATAEELASAAGIPLSAVLADLTRLELLGVVESGAGLRFSLTDRARSASP